MTTRTKSAPLILALALMTALLTAPAIPAAASTETFQIDGDSAFVHADESGEPSNTLSEQVAAMMSEDRPRFKGTSSGEFMASVEAEAAIVGSGGWVTNVIVVGGTGVVSTAVESQLRAQTDGEVFRLAGADRYSTAAAISQFVFPFGSDVVYVATGLNFPDALAGSPAAAWDGAPILLVSSVLPAATRSELIRLGPSEVVILGGTGVISNAVAADIAAATGAKVTRLAGTSRYGTGAAISEATFAPGVPVAYVAVGDNFPDALAGGPVAGLEGGPILLVQSADVPAETRRELVRLKPKSIVVLGGTGVISTDVEQQLKSLTTGPVTRLAGADRYSTAAAISKATFAKGVPAVIVATAENFPDALAAGPMGAFGALPLLLVACDTVPSATTSEINRLKPTPNTGHTITTVDEGIAPFDWVGEYTSIGVGGDGRPSIAYSFDPFSGSSYTRFAHCGNVSCTSATAFGPQLLGDQDVSMKIRSDGLATVATTGLCGAGCVGFQPRVTYCTTPTCSNNTVQGVYAPPARLSAGDFVSLALLADDVPMVAYRYNNAPVFWRCIGVDCSGGGGRSGPQVPSGEQHGTYKSAALSAAGTPAFAYYNETDGDLMFYDACDTSGSCGPVPGVVVDGGGDVGLFTSMIYGSDGLPAISYFDLDNLTLKFAHCNDAACTSASTTTIDGGFYVAGIFGTDTSITIGSDGYPIISYYELILPFLGRLKIADCSNLRCTAGTITVVDSHGDAGGGNSITIGDDGKPIVSYQDYSRGDLMVADIGS